MKESGFKRPPKGQFPETHWSLILAAGDRKTAGSEAALAELCKVYWRPLYQYVCRVGYAAEEATDLTQEFFARLLEKNYLSQVDRDRGRFRSFLLASLKHFLSNERDHYNALKRGRGYVFIPLEPTQVEAEPAYTFTPEKLYEREWALVVLKRAFDLLEAEFKAANKSTLFDHLKVYITDVDNRVPYSCVAAEIGIAEGAVKVAVHRLRRRYRDLLRKEIAKTINDPDEIDDEIRFLFAAVRS